MTVAALAAAPGLARVLGNLPSLQIEVLDDGTEVQVAGSTGGTGSTGSADLAPSDWLEGHRKPTWAAQGLGGTLLSSCIAVLGAKGCSEASMAAALSVIESCMMLQPPALLSHVLQPWVQQLLLDLKSSVDSVLLAAAATAGRKGKVGQVTAVCNVTYQSYSWSAI
jgi:hypothetical protein